MRRVTREPGGRRAIPNRIRYSAEMSGGDGVLQDNVRRRPATFIKRGILYHFTTVYYHYGL